MTGLNRDVIGSVLTLNEVILLNAIILSWLIFTSIYLLLTSKIFIGSLGEKFYMILDGEVTVLIPNPENRNFAHWLKTFNEERKNYERVIERETKRL